MGNNIKLRNICTAIAVLTTLLTASPQPVYAEWKNNNNGYTYQENGSNITGWKKLDYSPSHYGTSSAEDDTESNKVWYYFDNNGYMKTGWVQSDGKWYYLDSDGVMLKSCVINGYTLRDDGSWIVNSGWRSDSTGWWYSYGSAGNYATYWKSFKYSNSEDKWYYFDGSGYMKTGWIQSGGKWYYLNSDGSMAKDCTIDGYIVGSDGAWIEKFGKVNYTQQLVTRPEKSVYPLGTNKVNYAVINNTGKVIETYYGPEHVQKYEDEQWVDLKNKILQDILNGDSPIPERIPLDIYKVYENYVDLTDFEGFDSQKPGKYRIVFNDSNASTTLFEEFEIK